MKVSWPAGSTAFSYAAAVDVGPDSKATVDITRLSDVKPDPWRMNVVAQADGEVLSAMLDPRGHEMKGCTFQPTSNASMAQGRRAFRIAGGDIYDDFPEAIVGGAADGLHPKAHWLWQHSGGRAVAASDLVWVTWDSEQIGIAKWGEPWRVVFKAAQAGGFQQVQARPWHDFVTWESSNGLYKGVMAWTPQKGAYPFITFPGDWSQGAEGLGTDGLHMVWIHGEGKGPKFEPYPIRLVMVSPFTTDPAKLRPIRLRSYPTPQWGIVPWAVGCGHAAHELDEGRVLVVRLSDGWSWILSTEGMPDAGPTEQWRLGTVYGLTCDEVFLRAGVGAKMNIARVRLDALGPGMPPD